jgi:soluble lytic murein transglycosylase-like protein
MRGTYVHRGDYVRRRQRTLNSIYAVGFAAAIAVVLWNREPQPALAETATFSFGFGGRAEAELDVVRGERDLLAVQLDRANKVIHFSGQYRIGADLAGAILDVALAEGIEPDLAFRLVKLESDFNEKAVSSAGAIGLTQVMPSTAAYFERKITAEGLKERRTNLRIGFRYLRSLVKQYDGDLRLALLGYNRGPFRVEELRQLGVDPANGYDSAIMKGYKGTGVID